MRGVENVIKAGKFSTLRIHPVLVMETKSQMMFPQTVRNLHT
jgi:hypothetical protein